MDWVYYISLLALLLTGLFLNILGLPGLWLMVGSVAIYAWITGVGSYVGWITLLVLLFLALLAEVVEFLAGAAGSNAAGGSRRAMVGAVIGGLLGGLFLSLIPIPIITTIVGACLGAFLGAGIFEAWGHGDLNLSFRVGVGAAKGRFMGIVSKLAFGCAILLVSAIVAFPYPHRVVPAVSPSTAPSSTAPSSTSPSTTPATLPA